MARLNKFASVNLNESYGKPDQAGSTNAGANSSGSGKSRLPTQGGMVVLTKPGRGPTGAGSKSGRLGIPSPVNLPSLKREHSGSDTLPAIATSPPLPGWTKGSQGEHPTGVNTEKAGSGNSYDPSSGLRGGSVDNVTENLKSLSTSPSFCKPDVYAPPALRAIQANGGSIPRNLPPTPGEKAAVIRGEEFPTLQASLVRPPTPPQQSRQKESQQKQREKQQEIKEQQLKLQQLSHQQHEHAQKQLVDDLSQPGKGSIQLQPAQPFRPQAMQERPHKEVTSNVKHQGVSVDQTFVLGGGFGEVALSKSPPLVRFNHASNWADDERDRIQNDDERERGQILKRQNVRSSVHVGQDKSSIDVRLSGLNNEKELPWSSMHRDNLTSRNDEFTKNSRDFWTGSDGDMKGSRSKDGSDSRSFLFGRESYASRGNFTSKEPGFTEYGGKEGYSLQDFGNEWSGPRSLGKAVGPIREGVQGREGVYNRGWLGREGYNRDAREPYGRDARESYKRDIREPYESVPKEMHIRDNREVFSRDARDMYNRDFREVHIADVNTSRQVGYGNFSDDGGTLRRAGFGDTMLPPGRGNFHGSGAAANPGFGYDARNSRRYGFHLTGGDHPHVREARPSSASAALHGRYAEPSAAHFSTDAMGFRRTRSPTFDHERGGVYEAEFERMEVEQRKKFEEKLSCEDEGLGYTASKSLQKGDDLQGPTGTGDQADAAKKFEEDRRFREDEKKQLLFEEERRKEAARRKLLELEERITRRETEDRRKGEVEAVEKVEDKKIDDAAQGNSIAASQECPEEASLNLDYEEETMGTLSERNAGVGWKELDLSSKLARPSSASSSSSWTLRGTGEELFQEQDSGLGSAEAKFNQELKLLRSKSPMSWRKEANANGNGPTSKLFSSPYIESGGFHRATEGGNYKLF